MGLFSTTTTKQYTTSVNIASDLRTGVETMSGGVLLGPESTVGAPGGFTTSVGDYSSMTQTITGNKFKTGMSGEEVAALLREQNLGYATAAGSGAETQARMAALAATALTAQTGIPADWTKYIVPVALIIGVVMIARRHR
jgi:hypothetical protein